MTLHAIHACTKEMMVVTKLLHTGNLLSFSSCSTSFQLIQPTFFLLSVDCFPPHHLWIVTRSLTFGVPAKSNSAIVVFLSPKDLTGPSALLNLHSF